MCGLEVRDLRPQTIMDESLGFDRPSLPCPHCGYDPYEPMAETRWRRRREEAVENEADKIDQLMDPDRPPRVGAVPGKVLVVDDEASLRLLYRVNLEDEGMEVVEAVDGPSGLEKARSESPDVILLDVMMPGPDGWRVAESLRGSPATRDIPFIFVTPRRMYRDRLRGLELGAVDYVTLPCNPRELAPRIHEVLNRRAQNELEDLRREKIAEVKALMEHDPDGPEDG
jgi:CheY-like chemotaxis protein